MEEITEQKECKSKTMNLKQKTAFTEFHQDKTDPGFDAKDALTATWVAGSTLLS